MSITKRKEICILLSSWFILCVCTFACLRILLFVFWPLRFKWIIMTINEILRTLIITKGWHLQDFVIPWVLVSCVGFWDMSRQHLNGLCNNSQCYTDRHLYPVMAPCALVILSCLLWPSIIYPGPDRKARLARNARSWWPSGEFLGHVSKEPYFIFFLPSVCL